MDETVLLIFLTEIARQARFGLLAAVDLSTALGSTDTDRVWYSVQALLVAAGNVSKLLWPQRSGIPDRGELLRRLLEVPNSSVLEPRTFRNHFEHFDERVEKWATSSERRCFVDSNIGPTGMISGPQLTDFMRNFDTADYAVTYRGDKYPLKPVIDELRALHAKATGRVEAAILSRGGRSHLERVAPVVGGSPPGARSHSVTDRSAHIRPMCAGDYAAVRAVWDAAGLSIRPHGRDTEQAILSQLPHFPDTYLVAECDGRIVGTVLGTHDQRKGWINRLAVHPDYQCRGVARRLLEACEQALHAHGIEIIAALIEGDNVASADFFRAAGYELYGPVHYFRKRSRPDI